MGSIQNPARVLIVDDDPDLHELIARVVRRAGHQTLSAYAGEQGLSVLRDEGKRVDWLVTDIQLGGSIDGWIVGSEFALKHPLRPVIYMSGVDRDKSCRRASNSIFLQKPVNVGELLGIFARLASDPLYISDPVSKPSEGRIQCAYGAATAGIGAVSSQLSRSPEEPPRLRH